MHSPWRAMLAAAPAGAGIMLLLILVAVAVVGAIQSGEMSVIRVYVILMPIALGTIALAFRLWPSG